MVLFRALAFILFTVCVMSAGYFFALGIFWLWVMSLFSGTGFILFAVSIDVSEDKNDSADTL